MRIVDALIGQPPQTISELLPKVKVTRTAITEQLDELVRMGLVVREMEHLPSRGRPRYRYSLSEESVPRIYPGNQQLVVSTIWNAVKEIAGEELSSRIFLHACDKIKDYYSDKI